MTDETQKLSLSEREEQLESFEQGLLSADIEGIPSNPELEKKVRGWIREGVPSAERGRLIKEHILNS